MMYKILYAAAIGLSMSFVCKTTQVKRDILDASGNNCCIDTFKVKYQIVLGGGKTKKVDENFYSGILNEEVLMGGRPYKKMVFGDNANSVLAFVRQDDLGLYYVDTSAVDTQTEKPLFFFAKEPNDKWNIHIDSSYFWRKEVTFLGVEPVKGDSLYIYSLKTKEGYTSFGNDVTKIYYSKGKGIVKFVYKTHWGSTEVRKS